MISGLRVLFALAVCGVLAAAEPNFTPRVIQTKFPTEDLVVATAVVTEPPFGAVADGATDCTGPIQRAIDTVRARGGGVVFLPAGN
jgi:polygalacturonase